MRLIIKDLTQTFGTTRVLDKLSFETGTVNSLGTFTKSTSTVLYNYGASAVAVDAVDYHNLSIATTGQS